MPRRLPGPQGTFSARNAGHHEIRKNDIESANTSDGRLPMGLFGKMFEKKNCDICGGEIGLLGNKA